MVPNEHQVFVDNVIVGMVTHPVPARAQSRLTRAESFGDIPLSPP